MVPTVHRVIQEQVAEAFSSACHPPHLPYLWLNPRLTLTVTRCTTFSSYGRSASRSTSGIARKGSHESAQARSQAPFSHISTRYSTGRHRFLDRYVNSSIIRAHQTTFLSVTYAAYPKPSRGSAIGGHHLVLIYTQYQPTDLKSISSSGIQDGHRAPALLSDHPFRTAALLCVTALCRLCTPDKIRPPREIYGCSSRGNKCTYEKNAEILLSPPLTG